MLAITSLVTAALLCSVSWGAVLGPPPEGHHHISPRMVDSSSKCTADSDCSDPELHTCDLEHKVCKCKKPFSVLSSSGGCLPAKHLGEKCEEDDQCRLLDQNSTCEDNSCVCDSGFYKGNDSSNATFCSSDKPGGGLENIPKASVDPKMIIIIASLAIMFLGICVALHLFSKARFRNRRTIFNSPHPRLMHIKLGKRKKSSIHTHHLPPPAPPGQTLATRHHSFSGYQSPFPVNRVPKTRSHDCLRSALSREASPRFEHRPKTAPLAERESMLSSEDLEKKTPEPLQNGHPSLLSDDLQPPGSPTVIITDADGAHTVVTSNAPPDSSSQSAAVNV